VWRDGKKITIDAVLQSKSGETTVSKKSEPVKESKASIDLGMKVQELNDRQSAALDLDKGVVVAAVERRSAAAEAGLSQGDVIYEVANNAVKSVAGFYDIFSKYKEGDVVRIKVRRKMGADIFDRLVFIQIPKQEG
jgi:C-terminal processing protease CtpA/Prc